MTRDLRTLIYLLNLELREECSRTLPLGPGHGIQYAGRWGRNRASSSLNLELREECSRTLPLGPGHGMGWNPVCSRGAAVEGDAIGRAAVEADAIGEQQSKRTRSADRESGEQQLKRAQSGSSSWRRRQTGSSSGSGCRNRAREQQLKFTQAASSS